MDIEPGGEEKLVARGIPGFSSVYPEPGGEELVAHSVPGFSSV